MQILFHFLGMVKAMNVEEAFEIAGSFGRRQIPIFIGISSVHIFLGWQMVLMVFVGANPKAQNSSNSSNQLGLETIVTEWNLYDEAWIVSLVQSIFMLGVMIGNLLFGQLSDIYGRRKIFYCALAMLICTSFLSCFANNYQVLAAIRFFVGVFEGGTVLVSFVLLQELLGSSVWTISGNIIPALFALGIASLAGIASLCSDWRGLCVATSLPGLILLLSIFFVPESPRWLYSQGRIQEAEHVLRMIAAGNGVPSKSCERIRLQQVAKEKKRSNYSLKDLFSTKAMAIRTIVMGYLWFVCSFTYYGLTMGAGDLSSSLYLSLALSGLVELPSYLLCAVLIDRIWAGRRKTLVGMLLFCGLSCVAIMFVAVNKDGTSIKKLGLALGGKLAVSAAFSIVYIYGTELFPTVIRNVGLGASSVCARIGGIIAPFVPTLAQYGSSLPFVVFGFAAMVAALLTLLLPETLHQPVPDTIEDIEDQAYRSKKLYSQLREDKEQLIPA